MRLQQFINEKTVDPEQLISTLHKDCSDYFKNIRYGVKSFRGAHLPLGTIYIKKTPRKNRKPKDTDPMIHKVLDEMFYNKFGWHVRSEGVFATASLDNAEEFGTAYYFYPSNGFKMVWSNYIDDITGFLWNRMVLVGGDYHASEVWKERMDKLKLMDSYEQGGPKDLNKALQTFNEVAFKCKFYYLVNVKFVTEHFDELYRMSI